MLLKLWGGDAFLHQSHVCARSQTEDLITSSLWPLEMIAVLMLCYREEAASNKLVFFKPGQDYSETTPEMCVTPVWGDVNMHMNVWAQCNKYWLTALDRAGLEGTVDWEC